jgi:hypothetical protein
MKIYWYFFIRIYMYIYKFIIETLSQFFVYIFADIKKFLMPHQGGDKGCQFNLSAFMNKRASPAAGMCIYVCMYIYMCVFICIKNAYVYVCIYIHICIHTYIHIYISIHIYRGFEKPIRISKWFRKNENVCPILWWEMDGGGNSEVCVYACMYIFMYICMYLCKYLCIHVYMYVYIYMYVCPVFWWEVYGGSCS